jgi:hypothetical protein
MSGAASQPRRPPVRHAALVHLHGVVEAGQHGARRREAGRGGEDSTALVFDEDVGEAAPAEDDGVVGAAGEHGRRSVAVVEDRAAEVGVRGHDRATGRCHRSTAGGQPGRGFERVGLVAPAAQHGDLAAGAGGADEEPRRRCRKVAREPLLLPVEEPRVGRQAPRVELVGTDGEHGLLLDRERREQEALHDSRLGGQQALAHTLETEPGRGRGEEHREAARGTAGHGPLRGARHAGAEGFAGGRNTAQP